LDIGIIKKLGKMDILDLVGWILILDWIFGILDIGWNYMIGWIIGGFLDIGYKLEL